MSYKYILSITWTEMGQLNTYNPIYLMTKVIERTNSMLDTHPQDKLYRRLQVFNACEPSYIIHGNSFHTIEMYVANGNGVSFFFMRFNRIESFLCSLMIPDSKVHGDNMWPIWDQKGPVGYHVGPMNFAIWDGFKNWTTTPYVIMFQWNIKYFGVPMFTFLNSTKIFHRS